MPKLSRSLLLDLSILQCIRWHYMAINALPSKEAESRCLCSRRGINIMRTRHNFTYNVPYRLVLNWSVLELVTSVYNIYQHRPSRNWSAFFHQIAWHWMECRISENIPLDFVHIISESMLPILRSVSVKHKYLWLLCESDIHQRKQRIGTDCWQLYISHTETDQILELPVHLFCRYATDIASRRT